MLVVFDRICNDRRAALTLLCNDPACSDDARRTAMDRQHRAHPSEQRLDQPATEPLMVVVMEYTADGRAIERERMQLPARAPERRLNMNGVVSLRRGVGLV